MQVTLVAHYGRKPIGLATLLQRLQQRLGEMLGGAFQPHDIEQVHATVVGLEGCRTDGAIRGKRSGRAINLSRIVEFFRGDAFAPIQVRVGGYRAADRHSFRSRDEHPYLRSFSIQESTAVAIGWPVEGAHSPDSLDRFRRSLERFGVRHKWHTAPADVDNDCFVVLGRFDRDVIDDRVLEATAEAIRADLAATSPAIIEIDRETLSFVGYLDPALPRATSRRYALDEAELTRKLDALYSDCDHKTDRP
jgi:hypothetical protein